MHIIRNLLLDSCTRCVSQDSIRNSLTLTNDKYPSSSPSSQRYSSHRSSGVDLVSVEPTCDGFDFPLGQKNGVILKPPRQSGVLDADGGMVFDRTSYHYMCQDVTAIKTLLLKLRRILQVAEIMNPFDPNIKTNLYLSLGSDDMTTETLSRDTADITQENVDLKRQVLLLQQRLEEKDRSIRFLHQQLSGHQRTNSGSPSGHNSAPLSHCSTPSKDPGAFWKLGDNLTPGVTSNAATQTDIRERRSSALDLASSSFEEGLGPTVSYELENLSKYLVFSNLDGEDFTVDDYSIKVTSPLSPEFPSGVHRKPSQRIYHQSQATPVESNF